MLVNDSCDHGGDEDGENAAKWKRMKIKYIDLQFSLFNFYLFCWYIVRKSFFIHFITTINIYIYLLQTYK